MPSTPTTSLRLELQATGENISTWGSELNDSVISLIDSAIAGVTTKALTTSVTLTSVNYTSDESRKAILVFTDGGLSANPTVTIPAVSKRYLVHNKGATYSVIITAGGTSVTIRPGMSRDIYCDGTDVFVDDPTLDQIKTAAADFSVGSNKITSVKDPTLAQDAATKNYVDSTTATSAAAAASSASAAATSATNAATSATSSASSATASANSATNSANSATQAANSATQAANSAGSYVLATQAQAVAGTDNVSYMSALRVAQAIAALGGISRSTKTSSYTIVAADSAKLIEITSGTFTVAFTAAATLGNLFYCYLYNSGTGDVTLDPNSSETIDGLTSFVMYPGESRLITCDGSAFHSLVINPFSRTFTASGTFTKPPGYIRFAGLLWGAGGGGGKVGVDSTSADHAGGGGGGGSCVPFTINASALSSTETVTIGSGGTGASSGSVAAGKGGNSTLGSLLTAYGGGGGYGDASAGGAPNSYPGSGAGIFAAGTSGTTGGSIRAGGSPHDASLIDDNGFGGASGIGRSVYGGAGGGINGTTGISIFGGGGGGGAFDTSFDSGGTSSLGGNGGDAGNGVNGTAGSAPGGGGGATDNGTKGGDGGRGELRIWGVC